MALFDALFTHAPLATPDMQETRAAKDYLMFDPDDELCRGVLQFFQQTDQLDALLDAAAKGTLATDRNGARRRQLIERFVHMPAAGTAAQSVERFVAERLAA